MSLKRDLDPKFAMAIARTFQKKTGDLYERCEIAGSLRRGEPVVHDIDFAVIPSLGDYRAWRGKMKNRVTRIGGSVISFGEVIADFGFMGAQVNLFICPSEKSWGVTLMWATGPKGHTIGMAIKAQEKGLLINSQGIWTRDSTPRLLPARTEQDVGRILGWRFKPPEERGKTARKESPYP